MSLHPTATALVLASSSPRRRELLGAAGVAHDVRPAAILEEQRPDETPRSLVERLAAEKAEAVVAQLPSRPRRWVLGADTIVLVEGEVLGKPGDPEHAVSLLRRLVGRRHTVLTGVCVRDTSGGPGGGIVVESAVSMRPASEDELRQYVAGGEPLDKAGAYAIQGEGRRFIERVEGSETNVIGLPMEETLALLNALGALPASGRRPS